MEHLYLARPNSQVSNADGRDAAPLATATSHWLAGASPGGAIASKRNQGLIDPMPAAHSDPRSDVLRTYELLRMSARRRGRLTSSDPFVIAEAELAPGLSNDAAVQLERQRVVAWDEDRWTPTPVVRMGIIDLVPTELPVSMGRLTIRELVHGIVPATPVVQGRLRNTDDRVLLVEQLVLVGDEPLFHAVGYSPLDTADHVSASIRRLDRHPTKLDMPGLFETFFGTRLGRITVGVSAVRADLRTSRLLRLEAGTATLVREFLQYDVEGRARSYNFTQFHPDRVRLVAAVSSGREVQSDPPSSP
ncbi:MAG: UTRA domain-containing protein [Gordonia sp. (in: high G+C Gram-positive bacteria)]